MDDDSLSRVTQTQREYLALVSQGLRSKEIARLYGVSPSTIDVACTRALKATSVQNRFDLARQIAVRHPELLQSLLQRFCLSPNYLADMQIRQPNQQAGRGDGPASDRTLPETPDRQWQDLPAWQKQLWVIAIAFGTLGVGLLLVGFGHGLLKALAAIIH